MGIRNLLLQETIPGHFKLLKKRPLKQELTLRIIGFFVRYCFLIKYQSYTFYHRISREQPIPNVKIKGDTHSLLQHTTEKW